MLLSMAILGVCLGAAFGLDAFAGFSAFTGAADCVSAMASTFTTIGVESAAVSFGTNASVAAFGSRGSPRFASRFLLRLRPPRRLRPVRSGRGAFASTPTCALVTAVVSTASTLSTALFVAASLSAAGLSGLGVRSGRAC